MRAVFLALLFSLTDTNLTGDPEPNWTIACSWIRSAYGQKPMLPGFKQFIAKFRLFRFLAWGIWLFLYFAQFEHVRECLSETSLPRHSHWLTFHQQEAFHFSFLDSFNSLIHLIDNGAYCARWQLSLATHNKTSLTIS